MAESNLIPFPRLLTREDAAGVFDVSEKTIARWGRTGLLEERRIGPRLVRVTAESVEHLARGMDRARQARGGGNLPGAA
jgi:hypothetical protein